MSQIPVENNAPDHKNIFKRLYYGELPLDVTFWAFFGTAAIFMQVIFPWEAENLVVTYGAKGLLYIIIPRYIFLFVFTIVVLVGQWRAATKYTGKKTWAVLVKIITVVAALDCVRRIPDVWKMLETLLLYG